MPGGRRPTLLRPVLCLVTDRTLASGPDALTVAVGNAVSGGVNMVQLREKDLDSVALLDLARKLRIVTRGRALLIINGNPQVAVASQAMTVAEARRIVGPGTLIGRSVHSAEGAVQAQRNGADFLILGTVFESRSHPGGQILGVLGLRHVARAVQVPVIAIGGIGNTNARGVMAAGAAGVAVVSAILGSGDSARAARDLHSAISQDSRPDQSTARDK
jgi:thiamine-phosphate pyrophosphorylase